MPVVGGVAGAGVRLEFHLFYTFQPQLPGEHHRANVAHRHRFISAPHIPLDLRDPWPFRTCIEDTYRNVR